MNRFDLRQPTPSRHGMKASTRMSMIAGVVVFLTLISGVSFAAWTATSTKTATATTGAVSIATGATKAATTSTIADLGPVTYEATNQSVVKPITVWNTGSVAATLNSVTISRPLGSSNTLSGQDIAVKFWVGEDASCTAPTSVTSTNLAAGTVTLSAPQPTIAAGSSIILCASTTFTGSLNNEVRSISTELLLNASASANWKASDALAVPSRTFTQTVQQIPQLTSPNIQCSDTRPGGGRYQSTISWTPPTNAPVGVSYTVTFTPTTGAVKTFTQTATSKTFDASVTGSAGTVTVVATAPGYISSVSTTTKSLTYTNVYFLWIFYQGTDVRCG